MLCIGLTKIFLKFFIGIFIEVIKSAPFSNAWDIVLLSWQIILPDTISQPKNLKKFFSTMLKIYIISPCSSLQEL